MRRLTTTLTDLGGPLDDIAINAVGVQHYAETLDNETRVDEFNRLIEVIQQAGQKLANLNNLS